MRGSRARRILPDRELELQSPHVQAQRWSARLTPRLFLTLWLIGAAIRLATAFLYGTQDMEYWKAWGDYATRSAIVDMYGGTDQEIIALWKAGRSIPEIIRETQRPIPFRDVRYYSVTSYPLCQPPLFLYSIYPGAWIYRLVNPDMPYGYWFNFFTNLQPIFLTAATAWIIGRFVRSQMGTELGRLAALAYWLNPLVILNTPVQGYQDALCAGLAMLSVLETFRRRPVGAYVFLALALLTKPWALFIAPAVLWMCLREHPLRRNLLATAAAAGVSVLVCLPYIATGHFLSMVLGVLSLSVHAMKLSLQALNLWWPVQYAANTWLLMHDFGVSFLGTLWHPGVFEDVPTAGFSQRLGIPASAIAFGIWGCFTFLNLAWMTRESLRDRRVIILGCALQAYGWYMFRTGLQGHHSFIIIPTLSLLMLASPTLTRRYATVIGILFAQELLFYGFGRDWNPVRDVLLDLGLPWVTVALAIAHVAFFVRLMWELGLFDILSSTRRAAQPT
ncbi:MAG: hypothetical protein WA208_13475 [Thermoanaerobaculia bacterium]